eukprot:EST42191.1 Hypothetical protein SS50377_18495 [Spironucleus salmonicida]
MNTHFEMHSIFHFLSNQPNIKYLVLRNLPLKKFVKPLKYLLKSITLLDLLDLSFTDLKTSDFTNFSHGIPAQHIILKGLDINTVCSLDLAPISSSILASFGEFQRTENRRFQLSELFVFLAKFASGRQLAELKELKTSGVVCCLDASLHCKIVEFDNSLSPILSILMRILVINNKIGFQKVDLKGKLRKLSNGDCTTVEMHQKRQYTEVTAERPMQVKMVRKSHSCAGSENVTKLQLFMQFENEALGKKFLRKPTVIEYHPVTVPKPPKVDSKCQIEVNERLSVQYPRKCYQKIEESELQKGRCNSSKSSKVSKSKKKKIKVDLDYELVSGFLNTIFDDDKLKTRLFYVGNIQKIHTICDTYRNDPDQKLIDLFQTMLE